jgi:hypothetical protein
MRLALFSVCNACQVRAHICVSEPKSHICGPISTKIFSIDDLSTPLAVAMESDGAGADAQFRMEALCTMA